MRSKLVQRDRRGASTENEEEVRRWKTFFLPFLLLFSCDLLFTGLSLGSCFSFASAYIQTRELGGSVLGKSSFFVGLPVSVLTESRGEELVLLLLHRRKTDTGRSWEREEEWQRNIDRRRWLRKKRKERSERERRETAWLNNPSVTQATTSSTNAWLLSLLFSSWLMNGWIATKKKKIGRYSLLLCFHELTPRTWAVHKKAWWRV